MDSTKLREMAANCRQRSYDSFQNCDTDGFLSQNANDVMAMKYDSEADIADCDGKQEFTGLYQGNRRVMAKIISNDWGTSWVLSDSESELIAARGKPFLPTGKNSRILKKLGLQELPELDFAGVCISQNGMGVCVYRKGDKYGADAVLAA